jgi:hypothetical protein
MEMKIILLITMVFLGLSTTVVAGDFCKKNDVVAHSFYFNHSNNSRIFGGFYSNDDRSSIIYKNVEESKTPKATTGNGVVIIVPKDGVADNGKSVGKSESKLIDK